MQAGSSKVAKAPENIAFVKLVNPALHASAADGMAIKLVIKLMEFMEKQREKALRPPFGAACIRGNTGFKINSERE
jgi:hypothetical protein